MNDELISRSELLRQIRNSQKDNPFERIGSVAMVWHNVHSHVCSIIDAAYSVDAEPVRHGRWAHLGGDEWCCSHCGDVIHTEGSWEKPTKKYCSECGALMDLEGER